MCIIRNLLLHKLFMGSLIFTISYYLFLLSGFNYFYDDVYAYLSYSESLYNLGQIKDLTTFPSTPAITTQNGIVFIFAFLNYFTSDMLIKMSIVSFILTINLVLIYCLIYKIGRLLDIKKEILYIFILGLIFNFYFYAYYVVPTNDGFYVSLFLLSLYLFLKLYLENNQKLWIYLLIIVLVMPIFRLQGLVVYIAAFISFLIIKKEYKKSILILLFIILSLFFVKLAVNLLIEDTSGLEMISKVMIIYHLDTLDDSFIELFANTIPSMFLNFQALNFGGTILVFFKVFFSSLVILFLLLTLKNSFQNKNFIIFMIILIILGNFGALILFNVIIDRYIYINSVLILLLVLFYVNDKYHLYLVVSFFFISLLIFSIRIYYKQYNSDKIINNVHIINNTFKSYNLVSQFPRQTYFYLGKQSIIDLKYIDKTLPLLIIGDENFINQEIKKLLEFKLEIINQNNLFLIWEKENNQYNTFLFILKGSKN